MDFATQLRLAREAKGWSPRQLGEALTPTVSKQTVNYWEETREGWPKNLPRPHRVEQLEQLLNTKFAIPGGSMGAHDSPLPPGVTDEHVEVAAMLSQLPKAEYEAIKGVIRAAHSRNVKNVTAQGAFFLFNDRRRSSEPFFTVETRTNAQTAQGGTTNAQSPRRNPASPRTAAR